MEQQLARNSWMPGIDMWIFHLLEALSEDGIHEMREVGGAAGFAVFVVLLELVEGVAEVDDEILEEALAHFAHLALDIH